MKLPVINNFQPPIGRDRTRDILILSLTLYFTLQCDLKEQNNEEYNFIILR